jgi:hypothetical protein
MKNIFICLFSALLAGFPFHAAAADAPELKYGLYIHYGMDTFRHAGEKGRLPVERFAPASVNVMAWAQAAKEAGMTFAVLTAKHETGFCLWDSNDYNYDIAHSPFKSDIIADFIAACKVKGILPGVHYSITDGYNEGAVRSHGVVPPPYFNVIKQHITELNTKYPELRVLMADGSSRLSSAQFDELSRVVKRLNPQCAVWGFGNDGLSGPHHISASIISTWMWSPSAPLASAPPLFGIYQRCQTAGKAFVLNVGPMPSGDIPENQLAVLMDLKQLIANPPQAGSSPETTGGKPPVAERLKQVKTLYERGLINKEDYDRKVKEIIDSL